MEEMVRNLWQEIYSTSIERFTRQVLSIYQTVQNNTELIIIAFIVLVTFGAVWLVLRFLNLSLSNPKHKQVLVLLGSGGHTTQMCLLLKSFKFQLASKVHIVITTSDKSSQSTFLNFLSQNSASTNFPSNIQIHYIPRTNQVKQSKFTSIFTALYSTLRTLSMICTKLNSITDVIGNGPGFCVPFYFVYFAMNKIRLSRAQLIFIESWCRVDTLSLTGRILKPVCQHFIVHWKSQAQKYSCKYYGRLI